MGFAPERENQLNVPVFGNWKTVILAMVGMQLFAHQSTSCLNTQLDLIAPIPFAYAGQSPHTS